MSIDVELPDGRVVTIDTNDSGAAAAAAHKFMTSNPIQGQRSAPPGQAPAAPRNYDLSQVPGAALKNAPHDAVDVARNIGTAIMHPIDTVNALGDLAAGGLRAGVKAVLPTAAFNYIDSFAKPATVKRISGTANAFGQMMSDNYGGYEWALGRRCGNCRERHRPHHACGQGRG